MKIAVVGATGLVGRKTLSVLEENNIEAEYILYASKKSANKKIKFFNKKYKINELTIQNIKQNKVDFCLFCAGAEVSKTFVPYFIENKATVIDFSSQYRNTKAPLVVPEVNKDIIKKHNKLICNPNCSTIGAVVFLNQIYKNFGLEKIIVSTYQAVSGAGKNALDDLNSKSKKLKKFEYPIKDNTICYIGTLAENGYTTEEMKMVNEVQKIFNDNTIKVCSTCVRVPVNVCHGESIWFKTKTKCSIYKIREALENSENVKICDNYPHFPMPLECKNQDKVFVGRLRKDPTEENCFCAFIESDNLRKGASSNAVQILKILLNREK